MVKTKGPILSLGAGGTIGDTLTSSSWKGRAYTKRKVSPIYSNTGLQRGTRAIFAFLSSDWTLLTSGVKATWDALAEAQQISPFNAYLGYNLERFSRYKGPSMGYPATETGIVGTGITYTITQVGSRIRFYFDFTVGNNSWGIWYNWSTSLPLTPARSNVLLAIRTTGTGPFIAWWKPPAPDTYYFFANRFTAQGKNFPLGPGKTVVFT